jgi:N-acetyl-beta-hexosaminidase
MSVVEYARARGVRVLPEFDAPAHVGEGWQWAGPNVTVCMNAQPWSNYCVEPPCGQLNPTNDTVYDILGGIYRDMFALFDPDIFHMGGDEVSTKHNSSFYVHKTTEPLPCQWNTEENKPVRPPMQQVLLCLPCNRLCIVRINTLVTL